MPELRQRARTVGADVSRVAHISRRDVGRDIMSEYARFQYFWRCAHHPRAIENFFEKRVTCELDCHTTNLEWHHRGIHPMPKSWSTPRGSRGWAELQRNGL